MANDTGGKAFPVVADKMVYSNGMDLRDWFAGQALAGICSNCDESGLNGWTHSSKLAASVAYQFADAMLEARK